MSNDTILARRLRGDADNVFGRLRGGEANGGRMNELCQVCNKPAVLFARWGQWCGDCVPERIMKLQAMLPEKPQPCRDIRQRVEDLEEAVKKLKQIIEQRTGDS